MSVYTELSQQDVERLLSAYDLGQLVSFAGVSAGIENTNYRLTLSRGDTHTTYFLTLFEILTHGDLNFFVPLLAHLSQKGCSVAGPMRRMDGEYVFTIKNKPAALFQCLSGGHIENIEPHHCHTIGEQLARIHIAAEDFDQQHENARGFYWIQKQIQKQELGDYAGVQAQLNEALEHIKPLWQTISDTDAPKGFIHADLFPDNSLFADDGTISGVIDFYAGGYDYWMYDVAVTALAWCKHKGEFLPEYVSALLSGYQTVRAFSRDEKTFFTAFLKLACLRFWLSRIVATKENGDVLSPEKNPKEMQQLWHWLSQPNPLETLTI